MRRPAACLLFLALATPALPAQQPDLALVQTRQAFVAAVNAGATDILKRLLADDAVLRTNATTNITNSLSLEHAAAAPLPTRVEGRDAIIEYFKREFANGRIHLVAQQSDQSGVVASESGTLLFEHFFLSATSSTEGDYRLALIRTDEGWRITDVRLDSGTRHAPAFRYPRPLIPQPKSLPPEPKEPPPPPQFGVIPLKVA
jgi:hypothetical protein